MKTLDIIIIPLIYAFHNHLTIIWQSFDNHPRMNSMSCTAAHSKSGPSLRLNAWVCSLRLGRTEGDLEKKNTMKSTEIYRYFSCFTMPKWIQTHGRFDHAISDGWKKNVSCLFFASPDADIIWFADFDLKLMSKPQPGGAPARHGPYCSLDASFPWENPSFEMDDMMMILTATPMTKRESSKFSGEKIRNVLAKGMMGWFWPPKKSFPELEGASQAPNISCMGLQDLQYLSSWNWSIFSG